MSVRQYIGARYVTKIYENSLDPSSAEWEQGTFEPLVMVTWQNSTYLSKKQVPGYVGNPADNPDYWVCTGYYNGQIMQLQNDIQAIHEGFVTPEMFGAVGDGSTDDTAALATALAYNKVFLNPGSVYLISDQIALHSGLLISGSGTIKIAGHIAVEDGILSIKSCRDIIIDGVIFDSNVANQDGFIATDPFYNIPIYTTDSDNIVIKNCKFVGCYSNCIHIILYDGSLLIDNNEFICGSASLGYKAIPISIAQTSSNAKIVVTNNNFTSSISNYDYGYGGVIEANSYGLTIISHNKFDKIGRTPTGGQQQPPVDMYIDNVNTIIDGNEFKNCYWMTRIINSHHIKVINNIFDEGSANNPPAGIVSVFVSAYYGTPQNVFDINILNNYIKCVSASIPAIALYSLDDDYSVYDINISDNVIEATQIGIKVLNGTHNVIVKGNVFNALDTFALFFAEENTSVSNITPGNFNITNNVINCDTGYALYSDSNIASGTRLNKFANNKVSCDQLAAIKDPWIINDNEISKSSAGTYGLMVFTQQNSELVYLLSNVITGDFTAPSSTGIVESGDYINGVVTP